jgi:hypothetical protein
VAISAQQAGVNFLQKWDPLRYGTLTHPGDDYSFDIFSQAVAAVRRSAIPLSGLVTKRLIGTGQSQSAGRLNTYMSGTGLSTPPQNDANVVDGMLVIADNGSKKTFPDLRIPLIQFETQDSIVSAAPATNNPGMYRLWEIPGSSHINGENLQNPATEYLVPANATGTKISYEQNRQYWATLHYGEEGPGLGAECATGNEFPQRYALDAALANMDTWLRTGKSATQPPRATFDSTGALQFDQYSNAKGGLRLPPIDVPVATYDGTRCKLLGINIPLDPTTLQTLYKDHDDYVQQMAAAINTAVGQRIMVPEDAAELTAKVERSSITSWPAPSP